MNFYSGLGYENLAERCLSLANYKALVATDGALLDENIACLALTAAMIEWRRNGEYAESLTIARKVEERYIHLQRPYIEFLSADLWKHFLINPHCSHG